MWSFGLLEGEEGNESHVLVTLPTLVFMKNQRKFVPTTVGKPLHLKL